MMRCGNFLAIGSAILLANAVCLSPGILHKAKTAVPEENRLGEISRCRVYDAPQIRAGNSQFSTDSLCWLRTYDCGKDGDNENWEPHNWYFSIRQTRDGGFILADAIHPSDDREGQSDIWVVKLKADGTIDWQRCYGGDLIERFPAIETTRDGGYIVVGNIYSLDYEQHDIWILKLDSKGNIQWQKIYAGDKSDESPSIQQTKDGGYIVCGYTQSAGLSGMLFMKLDATGNIEWQRVYHGGATMVGVRQTTDGGYIVVGGINLDGNWEALVMKLDSSGYSEWQRAYGGPQNDSGWFSIQETVDGGYIVNCQTDSFCPTSALWILKLTRLGEIEWQRAYDGYSSDWSYFIQQTADGGYMSGGGTISFGAGLADILLLKLDSRGAIEWQRTYGASQGDTAMSAPQTEDGGFIIGGWTESFGNRLFIMKLPPDGDFGGSSGLSEISDMLCSETQAISQEVSIAPVDSGLVSYDTHIQPEEINAFEELLCWNLNQPPTDISVRREVNRSLFAKEAFHIIGWSANPENERFNIVEYRIYRKELEAERYELLGAVPGSASEYIDGHLECYAFFDYAMTSVDSEGHESPKSSPIRSFLPGLGSAR